jgi:hypothetical protein
VQFGIVTLSLSPWQLAHSTGFLAWITCGVSVWHFLQFTSLAVSKDAEKLASAAYAAVVNTTDIKIKRMIIFCILITIPQTVPVLFNRVRQCILFFRFGFIYFKNGNFL